MDVKDNIDISWADNGAKRVMSLLNDGYDSPAALFVGGCVRNALIGAVTTDIDIATIHTPQKTTEILSADGIQVIPTGVDHGTVTAVIDGIHYEITTLRRDVATTGRHAVVAFTTDWREDAMRRDFTMNTLLADCDGNVYEPLGQGVEDAKSGNVIFVGKAEERIKEDYLRILRFFRFHAFYGKGAPDEAALRACADLSDQIATLSKERIAQEFLKIMAAPDPVKVLDLMKNAHVLPDFFHEGYEAAVLQRLETQDVIARLIVLGGFSVQALDVYANAMTLSNKQQKRYVDILAAVDLLHEGQDVKVVIYRKGNEITAQALLLRAALDNKKPDLYICQNWQAPAFPVSGEDLKQARVDQGPEMGRILRELEDYWLQNDFAPDKSSLLARIK